MTMPCSCSKGNQVEQQSQVYVHTLPSGEQQSYSNETEVAAAVSRLGGTYRIAA